MGIYVMARWVVDFVAQNKAISSIRTELVPFLVDRQFQTAEYLRNAVPALPARAGAGARPLAAVDQWLHARAAPEAFAGDAVEEAAAAAAAASGESKGADGAPPRMELVDYIFQVRPSPFPRPSPPPLSLTQTCAGGDGGLCVDGAHGAVVAGVVLRLLRHPVAAPVLRVRLLGRRHRARRGAPRCRRQGAHRPAGGPRRGQQQQQRWRGGGRQGRAHGVGSRPAAVLRAGLRAPREHGRARRAAALPRTGRLALTTGTVSARYRRRRYLPTRCQGPTSWTTHVLTPLPFSSSCFPPPDAATRACRG